MTTRIRKDAPIPHVLFVDTNFLWHSDKSQVVDPEFEKFWKAYSGPSALELRIPEVVCGELVFQQTTSALNSLRKANAALSEIERITNKVYSHRITEARVRREVAVRLDNWVAAAGAQIIPTPLNVMPWADIVENSIWRKPPFEFDPKNADQEKGFRDALILETIVHHCASDTREVKIMFLCKDKLLRDSAQERLKADPRFSVRERIEDVISYLELTKKELTDKFIKGILIRASKKFWALDDVDSLYYKEDIPSRIRKNYGSYLDSPTLSANPTTIAGSGLDLWNPIPSIRSFISPARFVDVEDDNLYTWVSVVTIVQRFRRLGDPVDPDQKSDPRMRILILPIHFKWSAKITRDGRFLRYTLLDDKLEGNEFRELIDEDESIWPSVPPA